MSLMDYIPKVKCGRCDRSYSGLKIKCPYCGAGRGRGGKRASDAAGAQARRMIQILLLLILVISVVSMAVLDLSPDPDEGTTPPDTTQGTGEENGEGNGEDNGEPGEGGDIADLLPGVLPVIPTPTPVAAEVTSVDIDWSARRGDINEMTLRIGEQVTLAAVVWPTDTEEVPHWTSSIPTVANPTVHADDLRRATIEARSVGDTIVSVTVGDRTAEVIVRVRRP